MQQEHSLAQSGGDDDPPCKRTLCQAGCPPKGAEINKKSQRGNSWQGQSIGKHAASGSNWSTRLSPADFNGEWKVSRTGP